MTNSNSEPKVVALVASHREKAPGKRVRGIHGNTTFDISVQLPMAATSIHTVIAALSRPQGLSSKQVQAITGAIPAHVSSLQSAARAAGLTVLRRTTANKEAGIVRLKGRYSAFQKFFPGLDLGIYQVDKKGTEVVGREGSINVLDGLNITGVFGFDDRQHAHTYYRTDFKPFKKGKKPTPADGGTFPTNLTARGQALLRGIPANVMDNARVITGYVSLGGDNGKKMQKDLALAAAFDKITLNKGGMIGVNVDGTKLDGDYTDEATVENILDALQHRLKNPNGTCAVFVGGNNDDSFGLCIETAVAWPGINGKKLLSLTISWGNAQSANTAQSLARTARAYLTARLKGLAIVAATGDNGAKDNTDADTPDAPSSTPNGFGGAGVYIKVDGNGKIVEIGVWNDIANGGGATGGGIGVDPVQDYESALVFPVSAATGKAGHNASTLAGIAAPDCGPLVWWQGSPQVKGKPFPVGGTSNAAPEIGTDLALLQSQLKNPIKDMIAFVFGNHAAITDPITVAGDNGEAKYPAGPNVVYSVSTGFGVLNFSKAVAVAKKVQDGVGA
jgi:hypothetical protein